MVREAKKKWVPTCITAFSYDSEFDKFAPFLVLSMKMRQFHIFVDVNMVFGDYMSEYASDGDEK